MIYYLTKRDWKLTWRRCLEHVDTETAIRRELLDRIRLLPYETIFRMRYLPTGSYVFADLERLSGEDTERAAVVWNTLANANDGFRLFNHPIRSMRRFELLRHLYERNINTFNVYRLTDPTPVHCFPVFIRSEDDHSGSLTPLLHNIEELNDAVEKLLIQGKSKDNKIIVEYLDYKDEAGLYHKYSSIVVDSEIHYTSVAWRNHWIVKGENESSYGEHEHYKSEIREIFRLAHLDYGRMDYAIIGDRLQVFEINTNPTLWPPELLFKIAKTIDSSPIRRKVLVRPPINLHGGKLSPHGIGLDD